MPAKKEQTWEAKIDEKMRAVEKKVDALGKMVEEKGEALGKTVEKQAKDFAEKVEKTGGGKQTIFWGVVLIVLGFLWFGRNLGWFLFDIPWIPLSLIAVGLYLVIKNWDREGDKTEKS